MRRWLAGLLSVLLLGLGVLLAGGSAAYACSCVHRPDAPELVDMVDVVFSGRVVEQRVLARSRFLTFEVDAVYKGDAAARQSVRTHAMSSACGLALQDGERYVVHGRGGPDDLTTGLCDGTRPGSEVVGLGPGRAPRPGADGPSILTAEVDPVPLALGAAGLGLGLVAALLLRRRRRSARSEG